MRNKRQIIGDGWVVCNVLSREMQEAVDRLGIPLTVVWTPNPNKPIHGEIKESLLCIYDKLESDALATFMHEVIEFKFKAVTRVYRTMINSLINGYEKLAYQEKEEFIEFIPRLIDLQKSLEKE